MADDRRLHLAPTPGRVVSEDDLLAPYTHISAVPGKNFRGLLVDAFNKWLVVPDDKVDTVKSLISKLHNSSLVIDDIEDGSTLRRGVPAAHTIYGVAAAINSANYVYFLAMQEALSLVPAEDDSGKFRRLIELFAEEMCALHRGQGRDILFRDNAIVPTEEEYIEMVESKTGGLFRLCVSMLQLFSSFEGDFRVLLNAMGAYFQILDDYLNLRSDAYHDAKSFCEDITEGKYSFPVLHSIHVWAERGDDRLHKIIRKSTESRELKEYALKLIEETGSFVYTQKRLAELYTKMQEEVAALGGNEQLSRLLKGLHERSQQPTCQFSM